MYCKRDLLSPRLLLCLLRSSSEMGAFYSKVYSIHYVYPNPNPSFLSPIHRFLQLLTQRRDPKYRARVFFVVGTQHHALVPLTSSPSFLPPTLSFRLSSLSRTCISPFFFLFYSYYTFECSTDAEKRRTTTFVRTAHVP